MAYEGQSVLAVVPARGGSKGIPDKNLRHVGGLSLVARAAQTAKALDWIDAAIVSTDDERIAAEARAHGIEAPFLRPAELSSDTANSIDMWKHAWTAAEKHYGRRFDISVLLEPTSPMRRGADVTETVRVLLAGNHKAAATVSRAPAHFTPQKCLTVTDGLVGFYHAAGAQHSLRQSVPRYYFRNGVCYALKRATLLDEGRILGADTVAVVIERPIVNIDEPLDLEIAEFLLSREVSH
jgi:CMP-N,N'-diacetyllegionaminic acid synthase